MAIDFDRARTFGQRTGMVTADNTNEKPKAQVWINIGYETADPNYPFVSLPMGIALDTMEPIALRGRNEDFNAFVGAQNDFLAQVKKGAESLEPGEDMIIGLEGGMAIQIRRVSEAVQAPAPENNRFARQFEFATKAA